MLLVFLSGKELTAIVKRIARINKILASYHEDEMDKRLRLWYLPGHYITELYKDLAVNLYEDLSMNLESDFNREDLFLKIGFLIDHVTQVKILAEEIALGLGLPLDYIPKLRTLCLLHDLGKMRDHVFRLIHFPGRLTRTEYPQVAIHSTLSKMFLWKRYIWLERPLETMLSMHHRYQEVLCGFESLPNRIKPCYLKIIQSLMTADCIHAAYDKTRPYHIDKLVPFFTGEIIPDFKEIILRDYCYAYDNKKITAVLMKMYSNPNSYLRHIIAQAGGEGNVFSPIPTSSSLSLSENRDSFLFVAAAPLSFVDGCAVWQARLLRAPPGAGSSIVRMPLSWTAIGDSFIADEFKGVSSLADELRELIKQYPGLSLVDVVKKIVANKKVNSRHVEDLLQALHDDAELDSDTNLFRSLIAVFRDWPKRHFIADIKDFIHPCLCWDILRKDRDGLQNEFFW